MWSLTEFSVKTPDEIVDRPTTPNGGICSLVIIYMINIATGFCKNMKTNNFKTKILRTVVDIKLRQRASLPW